METTQVVLIVFITIVACIIIHFTAKGILSLLKKKKFEGPEEKPQQAAADSSEVAVTITGGELAESAQTFEQVWEGFANGAPGNARAEDALTVTQPWNNNEDHRPQPSLSRDDSAEAMKRAKARERAAPGEGIREGSGPEAVAEEPSGGGFREVDYSSIDFGPVLGSGGFGTVYKAVWRSTVVAVKLLHAHDLTVAPGEVDAGTVAEFRQEVKLLSSLRSPNVVMFMGACTQPPHLAMVMEYTARGSLYNILRKYHPSPPPAGGEAASPGGLGAGRREAELGWVRRLQLMLDIALGMNFLHTAQPPVVHRDLKSPNVLIAANWQAKISDLGLSRVMEGSRLVGTQSINSPRWVAPEVLRGCQYDTKSDVYSYGVILWELVTLKLPWEEEISLQGNASPFVLVNMVANQDQRLAAPRPEEVHPPARQLSALSDLMLSCYVKEPSQRPPFSDTVRTLARLLDTERKWQQQQQQQQQQTKASANGTRANGQAASEGTPGGTGSPSPAPPPPLPADALPGVPQGTEPGRAPEHPELRPDPVTLSAIPNQPLAIGSDPARPPRSAHTACPACNSPQCQCDQQQWERLAADVAPARNSM